MSEEHLTLRRDGHLPVRVASLVLVLLIVLPLAGTVSSEGDPSHIQLDSSRADKLDLDNDGDPDTTRVVYLVNTSAHYAEAAVEVSAESEGMVLTFWDNFTFNRSTPRFGSIDIEAWGDGIYSVRIRVWDAETGMLVAMEELGEHELAASLYPPYLRFDLEAPLVMFLGDDCIIERVFLDEVGERYDAIGVISLTGTPWLAPPQLGDIDCSDWPARDYHLVMHYRNQLGFSTQADLDFRINNLPPPRYVLNVTGDNDEVGSPCSIALAPSPGTVLARMLIEWDITDPRGNPVDMPSFSNIDCSMWPVGLSKVRVTVTNSEGQKTMQAYNLVRLPPLGSTDAAVLNASGDPSTWPERSLGDELQPKPFIGDSSLVAQSLVFSVGALFAIAMGILAALYWTNRREEEYLDDDLLADGAPDSQGLSSYTDESGIYWRQHPEGYVDWWDAQGGQWVPYEE